MSETITYFFLLLYYFYIDEFVCALSLASSSELVFSKKCYFEDLDLSQNIAFLPMTQFLFSLLTEGGS